MLQFDFKNILGPVKPVHGVNNCARQTNYGPLLPDFVDLHVPFSRLHDTGGTYGGTHYVDIANVFPDFSADADDPASYDFTLTDYYIKPLVDAGIKVMYRLGTTIEHEPKKYRIFAPSDPEKWADVAEHIVRHYNDGWAEGFHFNIEYWEIWNEPDGLNPACEPYGCPNFIGTAKDYYRLYSLTAKRIKRLHPEVKVGGYSSCYILGKFSNGRWEAGDAAYFTDFLSYISSPEPRAPLDFFTWHGYLGQQYLEKIEIESRFVDETLDRYGFTETERIDAEWNINICDVATDDRRTQYYINYRNEKGGSHCAAALYEMQRCKVDAAMYYDTQLWQAYGALFHVPSLQPTKAYYALKQFGELYALGKWCGCAREGFVYACAATDGKTDMLAISNIGTEEAAVRLDLQNPHGSHTEILLCDRDHDYEPVANGEIPCEIFLPPYSFITIRIR